MALKHVRHHDRGDPKTARTYLICWRFVDLRGGHATIGFQLPLHLGGIIAI
jgi:hypothetical protein